MAMYNSEPGASPQRRKSRWILATAIGIFSLAACALCPFTENALYFLRTGSFIVCREISRTSPDEIEKYAHVKFTPTTTDVLMYSPADCEYVRHFYIRFQIDPADLDAFVASTRVESLTPGAVKPAIFSLVPDSLGWHLDSVEFTLVGTGPDALDYQQTIGVDTTNPGQYMVYLVVVSHD